MKKVLSSPFLSILKLLLGFLAGTVCYVLGFIIGGVVMDLLTSIAILPSFIDKFQASLTASALTANSAAVACFSVIDRSEDHAIAFSIWLIILAAVYFTLSIWGGDWNLLWYPILSVILNGILIKEFWQNKGAHK